MTLLTKLRNNLLVGLAGIVMACSPTNGGGRGNSSSSGCMNDSDCKGSRVCVDGECVNDDGSDPVYPIKDVYTPKDNSSTVDTSPISCAEYTCNDGKCINANWVCDGETDCSDGEDEIGCAPACVDECNVPGLQSCSNNTVQLCTDNDSDSCVELVEIEKCGINYSCIDGQCVQTSCFETEYTCNDGKCINVDWVCDGETDCSDGEDEIGCAPACVDECNYEGQKCFENTVMLCYNDGLDSCLDELNIGDCSDFGSQCVDGDCVCFNYTCNDGKCINTNWVCDGETDCSDGEDEIGCAPACVDECSLSGQTKCFGNGWKECGDYDTDSCLEFSNLNSCSSTEKCENGGCIENCVDECGPSGLKDCLGNDVILCTNDDSDQCLEWITFANCGGTYSKCIDGECKEPIDEYLMMFWNFENGNYGYNIVNDSSGKGNFGKIHGATWTKWGLNGNALNFDGVDDYVEMSYHLNDLSTEGTVCLWFKLNDEISGQKSQALMFSGKEGWSHNFRMNLKINGLEIMAADPDANCGETILVETEPWLSDTWHQVCYAFEPGYASVMINGDITEATKFCGLHNQATSAYLGGYPDGGLYFNGRIDDVSIYSVNAVGK